MINYYRKLNYNCVYIVYAIKLNIVYKCKFVFMKNADYPQYLKKNFEENFG